jgi:flagellar secretion chaperone FliS
MGNASDEYLRSSVLTASPEQLLLMLYDGAIRFTRQGVQGIRGKDWEQAFVGFSRAQKIILELLNSLNYDVDRTLCTRMAGLYNYIYRHLIQACAERSVAAAEEALRFLEYQRETWLMLIDQLNKDVKASQPATAAAKDMLEPAFAESTYGTLSIEG